MAQVSQRSLTKQIESRIYQTLWDAFSSLNSSDDIQTFLGDLLSPTERKMVAKRLAVATLLTKGYNYQSIKEVAKVSGGTIAKVSLILNSNNGYRVAIDKIAKSEATRQFWQNVESLIYRFGSRGNVLLPETVIRKKLGHKKRTIL